TILRKQFQAFLELAIEWLTLFLVIKPKLLKSQLLTVRPNFTDGIAGTDGEQFINHTLRHRLRSRAHTNKTTFLGHPIFLFEVRLFTATSYGDFDNFLTLALLNHHIKQAHGRGRNIVFDTVFDFEHVAVRV